MVCIADSRQGVGGDSSTGSATRSVQNNYTLRLFNMFVFPESFSEGFFGKKTLALPH